MMLTTGILMLGKMSVGVRKTESVPRSKIRIASTTNVYGRFSATLTIHMISDLQSFCPARPDGSQPNRLHGLCLGVLVSRVEISRSAAGGTATVRERTISFAEIFLP